MRRISSLFSVLLISGCIADQQSSGTYLAPLTAQQVANREKPVRSVTDGFSPQEQVVHSASYSGVLKARTATLDNGIIYTYYGDGSGSVRSLNTRSDHDWSIDCTRDKMSDKRNCSLRNERILILYGDSSSPQLVCIREHDFPGKTGAIRLDTSSPIATNQRGCVPASKIFPSLLRAKNAVSRFYKWPYEHTRDHETPLDGLPEAHKLVGHLRAKLDKLSFD